MSKQTSSTAQVEKEQGFVKDKAEDVVQGVRKVKEEGLSKPSVPTTEGTVNKLDKAENAVDRAQSSERVQQMGGKGQEVLTGIKNVIADEKAVVRKNEGDLLQRIFQNCGHFLHDLSHDSSMTSLFSNWQALSGSLFNTGNMSEALASGTEIIKSMKDTEEFLHLASEMINMLKLLVAEGQERLTDNRSGNLAELQSARQAQKKELMEDLVELLRALAANQIFTSLTARAKGHARHAKNQGKEVANDTLNRVLDSQATSQLITDVKTFLQRLVGDEMDVNDFFNALAQVLVDFSENQELADLFCEMQDEMQDVADHPTSLDDVQIKHRLEKLSERVQTTVDKLLDSPSFVRLRKETQRLSDAIKNEPANARLLSDTRKLWNDIRSEEPGKLFDPALLSSVRQMIIPMFLDHLSNVPIPSISDTGDMLGKYDYTLSNIKLDVPELLPENIHLRFDHEMDANLKNLSAANQRTYIFLEARDIQVHLRNIEWSFHRRRLPRYEDAGRANVDTDGRGIIIGLKMELRNDTSNNQLVEIHKARVFIDRFHIAFSESKHNKTYRMLTSMFSTRIKRAVEEAIENKLKDFGSTLNTQIISMLHEAKTRSHEYQGIASQKLEQAQHKAGELKQQALESKEKAKEKMHDAKELAQAQYDEKSATAKGVLREQAQRATGTEDPEAMIGEAKQEVKARAQGAITLAAERATAVLDQQQQKIEEQRLEKAFDHQVNLNPSDKNWEYNKVESPAHASSGPASSAKQDDHPAKQETPEEKEERERLELQDFKRKQQAGSSDVPLGFQPVDGSTTTSADITFGLHSGIPSFDAPSPKLQEHKEHKEPAKQGL